MHRQFSLLLVLLCAAILTVEGRRKEIQEDFEFVEDGKEKSTSERPKGLVYILDPENELCGLLRCRDEELCLLQDRFTAVCVNKEEAARYGDRIVSAKDTPSRNLPPSSKTRPHHDDTITDNDEEYDDDDEYLLNDEDDDDDDLEDDDEDMDDESDDENVDEGDDVPESNTKAPRLNKRPFARKQCSACPVVRPVFLCGSDNKTYSSLCRLRYHNCLHEAAVTVKCKGFCPCRDPNPHLARKERKRQRKNSYGKKLKATAEESMTSSRRGKDATRRYNSKLKPHKKYYKSNKDRQPTYAKYSSKYSKDKYRKADKYYNRKRDWSSAHINDVTYSGNNVWGTNECSQSALEAMGNRMLDWFSVIMADSRRRPANPTPGPSWCKKEVSWMLGHLDQDNDARLSVKELYRLEHDDRERCIKPFIDRCDLDRDLFLSAREWCKCYDNSERPCAALRKASKGLLGGYIPECDSEGYYRPTQCHVSAAMCWCVDKHGVEISGSRTRSSPNCESVTKSHQMTHNRVDDDSDSDDGESYEGSADMPLDI